MPITLAPDENYAKSAFAQAIPAANTAASITVTPKSGEIAVVDWLVVSWSAAPDIPDTVTVTIGGTASFTWLPGERTTVQGIQIMGPWIGEKDEVIVVAVTAPAAATAALSIKYRKQATIT